MKISPAEMTPLGETVEGSSADILARAEQAFAEQGAESWFDLEQLEPAIDLACRAHEGHDGLDGRPLAQHSANVMLSSRLSTLEERQLGMLHDAATPAYSNLTQKEFVTEAQEAGISPRVIAAALCFSRPPEHWSYDDWISYLMRDDLTRLVKLADSEAAIADFPPANENQLAAWQRTKDRLEANEPESPDTTARIAASMELFPLPLV